MSQPFPLQSTIQRLMLASGMAYAVVQIAVLVYAGIVLLPLLGPAGGSVAERYEGYAQHPALFKTGNYLMGLPTPFFLLFLGGLFQFFNNVHESIRGILFVALLCGAALIMIWPLGAIVSVIGVNIAAAGGDTITGGAFDSIVPYSLGLSALPRAVFLFTLSVLFLQTRWLSLTGFVIAALSLLGNLIIANGSFLPLSLGSATLFHLWVFACSLHVYRKERLHFASRVSYQSMQA